MCKMKSALLKSWGGGGGVRGERSTPRTDQMRDFIIYSTKGCLAVVRK